MRLETAQQKTRRYRSFSEVLPEAEGCRKEERRNVIFPGPPGGCKTRPAVAPAAQAGQSGISIYFTTMEFLSRKLEQDQDSARQGKGRGYNVRLSRLAG